MKRSAKSEAAVESIDREARVREAAYFHYERNGCVEGRALQDWLAAEAQVDGVAHQTPRPKARPKAKAGDGSH